MKDDAARHTGKARRAYRTVCLIGLLGSVCECSTAYAGPLDLDQTFKGTGKVVTDFQLGGAPGDYGNGVAIDQTGKIIVVGSATNGNKKSDFALARYLPDGNADNAFGTSNNGRVTTDFGLTDDVADAVVIQPADGKIVVAGDLADSTGKTDIALARYNSDGTPDESFGNSGIVQQDFGADELVSDVALQSDGMIVVAGKQSTDTGANFLIARFMPNGDVDTSFGDNDSGTVVTDLGGFDSVRAIAIQKDHKIVVAGSTWFGNFQTVRGVLARYDESGNLDASFDQGLGLLCLYFHSCGKLKINLGGGMADYPDSVALRKSDGTEDGKIVVAGAFGIARFNANGTLDHDFGNSGIMDQPDNSGTAVAILANDDIVVAGTDVDNFALAIYEPSGQRCAGDSSITTDFDGPYSGANAIAIDADGKILVAGSANNGNNSDFALARYKGGKCPIVVATNFLAYHIYVPPWDLIGPPAPLFRDTRFNNLEIGLSKQLAFRTSDSATYSGAGSLGYQAFELIPSAEERKANVSASITNPLGDSSLQILEANQLLIPTEIAAEPTGSTNAPDALSLPFLKCYRAKRTVDVVAPQETKSVTVTDALKRTWTIGVGEPTTFCRPIDRHGREGVSRELSLVGYEIKSINVANKSEPSRVSVANEFGARVLKLEQPEFLFLSSLVE